MERIQLDVRRPVISASPWLVVQVARRSSIVTIVGAAASEDGEREKRSESWKRACKNPNAGFDYGPQTDLACAEHEFGGIAVET